MSKRASHSEADESSNNNDQSNKLRKIEEHIEVVENIEVKLLLIDFHLDDDSLNISEYHHHDELFLKLNEKMVRRKRISIPLSTKFKHVGSLQDIPNIDFFPNDITISYTHSCILIYSASSTNIYVFDLTSKQFKTTLMFDVPVMNVCIEENFDPLNDSDALVFGSADADGVYKYGGLGKLLLHSSDPTNTLNGNSNNNIHKECFIWKSTAMLIAHGIALLQLTQQVLVCSAREQFIAVLCLKTGSFIERIRLSYNPRSIHAFPEKRQVIICEINQAATANTKIGLFQYCMLDKKWKNIKTIDKLSKGELFMPLSVIMDSTSQNVIMSGALNRTQTITMFSLNNLQVLKSFKTDNLTVPARMCLNELSGELLVCHPFSKKVHIYK